MTTILLVLCAGVTGWLLGRLRPDTNRRLTTWDSQLRHPSNSGWRPRPNLRLIDGGYRLYDFDGEALEHDGGGAA